MPLNEYDPKRTFPGVIGRTIDESTPAWPQPLRSKPGAQNVLFIVLDDTGYGHFGCFGSPIRTPNLDRLAQNGLRYSNMHTTALCSPSRSCISNGRNHHSNGMACITEGATGYPGSNGLIPFENGFLSEMLQPLGYNTFAVGKWHLTPTEQTSAAGPFDRWPLGRGFDRFYGFMGGDTSQYYPDLVEDNHSIRQPRTPEQGYHLTEDLVDQATRLIADAKQVAPEKPFFMYFCTGAMHAPHQVPKEWADRYKGEFDEGWDKYREKVFARQQELGVVPPGTRLSRHDPDVADWNSLSADERKLYARMMEVFAGFLEHTDHHIGRLVAFLERLGGPRHFNHYPWGWAWAGNTPFRRWKRETYRGGVADPFIVHWPKGIRTPGEVRTQYAHVIDMVPTVLDALGVEPPAQIRGVTQSPIEGVSFAHTFDDAQARSKHHTQYFEMFAHRAIYHDGWRAVCPVPGPSFVEANGQGIGDMNVTEDKLRELDAHGWELYHVDSDFAETHDVASENRAKLIEMIALWYVEAGKYHVLPLDSRGTLRLVDEKPQLARARQRYVFFPGTSTVPNKIAPKTLNRPYSITATVECHNGAEGVLIVQGGNSGGYSLYLRDRKLHYTYNYVGIKEFHIESDVAIGDGRHELRFEFEPSGVPDIARGRGARRWW
jgi:arylsulfatase A-like enzyme